MTPGIPPYIFSGINLAKSKDLVSLATIATQYIGSVKSWDVLEAGPGGSNPRTARHSTNQVNNNHALSGDVNVRINSLISHYSFT